MKSSPAESGATADWRLSFGLFSGQLSGECSGVHDLDALIALEFQQMVIAGDDVMGYRRQCAGREFVVGWIVGDPVGLIGILAIRDFQNTRGMIGTSYIKNFSTPLPFSVTLTDNL
jgi:hypothetical protein